MKRKKTEYSTSRNDWGFLGNCLTRSSCLRTSAAKFIKSIEIVHLFYICLWGIIRIKKLASNYENIDLFAIPLHLWSYEGLLICNIFNSHCISLLSMCRSGYVFLEIFNELTKKPKTFTSSTPSRSFLLAFFFVILF